VAGLFHQLRALPESRPAARDQRKGIDPVQFAGPAGGAAGVGGFNEKLYPNEENALMDELQKRGGKLLYDPELIVYRRPRPTFRAFLPDALELRAGPGGAIPPASHDPIRAEFCSAAVLPVPGAVAVSAAVLLVGAGGLWRGGSRSGAGRGRRGRNCIGFRPSPADFREPYFYGLGFWRGCLTKPKPPPAAVSAEVKLEKLQSHFSMVT
jgi:hypothetical protein